MNKTIINNWNNVVSIEDTVYHIGDFCFGNGENILNQLNGNINLISGNHDKNTKLAFKSIKSWDIVIIDGIKILLIHYPVCVNEYQNKIPLRADFDVCFYGHVHNSHSRLKYAPKFLNCSIEVLGYYPRSLEEILSEKIFDLS